MTVPPPEQFRSQTELVAYLSALQHRVTELEGANQQQTELQHRVSELEGVNQQQQLTIDELRQQLRSSARFATPDTDLLNRSFIKRAFAVWGHNFVASLIVGLIVSLIALVILLIIYYSAGGIYPFLQ